jgi:hypothetical protein
MKMMLGLFGTGKQVAQSLAPTLTNISINRDAEMLKKATLASPATARKRSFRSREVPPEDPLCRHALEFLRVLQIPTTSLNSCLASSMPATSAKATLTFCVLHFAPISQTSHHSAALRLDAARHHNPYSKNQKPRQKINQVLSRGDVSVDTAATSTFFACSSAISCGSWMDGIMVLNCEISGNTLFVDSLGNFGLISEFSFDCAALDLYPPDIIPSQFVLEAAVSNFRAFTPSLIGNVIVHKVEDNYQNQHREKGFPDGLPHVAS